MNSKHILIVDDDPHIIGLLRDTFHFAGYKTSFAMDGIEALRVVKEEWPDMVILDLILPEIDGFEVCQRVREWSQVPIIALSARSDMEDKVKCLTLGADDYVTKPFGTDELLVRMQAVFRRSQASSIVKVPTGYISDDFEMDFETRVVISNGNTVILTKKEYELLYELVINRGKVLTYKHILNKIWGTKYIKDKGYVHAYTKRLRSKIEYDPNNPKYIISVYGVGYKFRNE